jgi:hypothetical protein
MVITPAHADVVCNTYTYTGHDDTAYPANLPFTLKLGPTEYENVFITTNGTLTFGQPDATFHDYPQTPSVSVAGYDWVTFGQGAYVSFGSTENTLCVEWSLRPYPQSQGDLTQIRLVINKYPSGTWHGEVTTFGWLPDNLRRGIRYEQGEPVVTIEGAFDVGNGGVPVEVPTSVETDFKITAEQLEKAITPKTKMMWFSSPCNPSGSVYNREELTAIGKVLEKHPNIYIVSDEIYEHINFSGTFCSIGSIPGLFERTITVNGVAKAFAMTGWRIGYIGAPEFIAKACTKMQGQVTSGANSIAQRATITAVDADPKVLNEMVTAFKNRRDLVVSLAAAIPGLKTTIPDGAFYLFPDVSYYFGKTLRGTVINNADDF